MNIERFRELKKHLPEAFNNSVIEWRIVGQTDCKNPEEARHYFHGFVIDYQPASTPESTVKEIKSIQYLALNDSLGKDTIYYKEVKHYRKRSIWTGYFLPRSKRKQREQVVYTERSIWNRKRQYSKTTDTIVTRLACREFIPSEYAITFIKQHTEDSTIFAIMNRNKNWRDMVFVVDVTGSMSTYNSQLFIWYKLNQRQREVRNFTFFNDGDSKRDGAKKVGKTGGIYCIDAKAQEEVIKKAMFCMDQGCGGDTPENNCEALLKSIQENPDSKEFFMIADNWANIRDTALISRITKPVHILLCGVVNDYYNEDYLARRTKGSVHTIDKDILDLCRLSEGEKIKLGEKWYIIHKGRLEKLIES